MSDVQIYVWQREPLIVERVRGKVHSDDIESVRTVPRSAWAYYEHSKWALEDAEAALIEVVGAE